MNKQTKKVTLDNLSAKVDKLASSMEAGFKQLGSRMDKRFKEAKEDNQSLARMVANGFEHTATKADIARLEQGQENIQLRVDSLAPQFEVKGLERRVKRLEDRAGIRHTIHSQ
ncbi:MAG: hypothetical protein AAB729_03370 [Patescibacteria group bacterium]